MTAALSATGLVVRRGRATLLDGVDVAVAPGELVAVVGPNGAGKSTLVGVLAGDLRPDEGAVQLAGRPLGAWSVLERARRRAVVPQDAPMTSPFTVDDVVRMGRAPWWGTGRSAADDEVVARALAATEVAHLAGRAVPSLSGGERARVAVARALAQEAPVLLLDEPTAALDLRHQVSVLGLARARADAGDAVLAVLHDLGAAASWADRLVLLVGGRVRADGPPGSVLDAEVLSAAYGHRLDVVPDPRGGGPLVLPARP